MLDRRLEEISNQKEVNRKQHLPPYIMIEKKDDSVERTNRKQKGKRENTEKISNLYYDVQTSNIPSSTATERKKKKEVWHPLEDYICKNVHAKNNI